MHGIEAFVLLEIISLSSIIMALKSRKSLMVLLSGNEICWVEGTICVVGGFDNNRGKMNCCWNCGTKTTSVVSDDVEFS